MSRKPDVVDAFIFYGADAASNALQDSLEEDLRKKGPDWGLALLKFGGLFVSEVVKVEVNAQIDPKFRSSRSRGSRTSSSSDSAGKPGQS